ncbi:MAG: deoxyribose-phosphate aldolase [Verrucomicrobiota bacterium]
MNLQNPQEFFSRTELVLVRPDVTRQEVETACAFAREKNLRAICVNSSRVAMAFAQLEESEVKVISTLGFPFGVSDSDVKRYEAEVAIDNGAQEFELVLNLGEIKDREQDFLLREVRDIVHVAEERPVSLLFGTKLLSRDEQTLLCDLAMEAGAKFVNVGNADFATIKFLRQALGEKFLIKTSADIADETSAREWLAAGATHFAMPSK